MATISKATTTWQGDLAKGSGLVSTASGVVKDAPVSWARRAEERSAGTSPEELIAAAHASCFSMAFAARLAKNQTPPTSLTVTVNVTFDKGEAGFKIISSAIDVVGAVPRPRSVPAHRRRREGQLPGVGGAQGQRRDVGHRDAELNTRRA